MGLLRKRVSIAPNHVGYLYKRNRLFKKLSPGIYYYFDFRWELQAIALSNLNTVITVTNQDGSEIKFENNILDNKVSTSIFNRTNEIYKIEVNIGK